MVAKKKKKEGLDPTNMLQSLKISLSELMYIICTMMEKRNLHDIQHRTLENFTPVFDALEKLFNPTELGGAPFALTTDSSFECLSKEININLNSGTRLYGLPCIAGHVGADAAAATLAEEPYKNDFYSLIIDVGTNAEIILGNSKRTLAASSPTGPAFEGAQITCGQRAAPGAIERVRIDKDTLEPCYAVIGTEGWVVIWSAGFIFGALFFVGGKSIRGGKFGGGGKCR